MITEIGQKNKELSHSSLLPKVSWGTISQFIEIDPSERGKFKLKGNPLVNDHFVNEAKRENSLLFLLLNEASPFFLHGGILLHIPLHLEAIKQGKKLPRVSQETITGWCQSPLWQECASVLDPNLNPEEERKQIKVIEARVESQYPSFSKWTNENKFLMAFVITVLQNLKSAGAERGQLHHIEAGALATYEILRRQAERERLAPFEIP